MDPIRLQTVAAWILAVGREGDSREGRAEAHQEVLGEVYLNVLTELNRVGITNIDSPTAFVRSVARAAFRRARWRERTQAAKHTPTQEDSVLESGVAIDLLGCSSPPSPLDELTQQEDVRTLATIRNELSAPDQQLLGTLAADAPKGLLGELARQTGRTVRTLQRRRTVLRDRVRRVLDA